MKRIDWKPLVSLPSCVFFSSVGQRSRHHDGRRAGVFISSQHHRQAALWAGVYACFHTLESTNQCFNSIWGDLEQKVSVSDSFLQFTDNQTKLDNCNKRGKGALLTVEDK